MSVSTRRRIIYEEKLLGLGLVGFVRQGVDATGHPRFDAGGGVLVHCAGGRKLIELSRQGLKMVLCFGCIASINGGFQVLNLRFDHALSRTIDHTPFGGLTNSFLGR